MDQGLFGGTRTVISVFFPTLVMNLCVVSSRARLMRECLAVVLGQNI